MVDKFTKPPYGEKLVEKINEIIDDKQENLVSGSNIKTINGNSLLGSGNIDIQSGGTVDQTYDSTSTNAQSGVAVAGALTDMQTKSNLVTSVSSSSTNSQYPSAKLFYDTCGNIESLINAL